LANPGVVPIRRGSLAGNRPAGGIPSTKACLGTATAAPAAFEQLGRKAKGHRWAVEVNTLRQQKARLNNHFNVISNGTTTSIHGSGGPSSSEGSRRRSASFCAQFLERRSGTTVPLLTAATTADTKVKVTRSKQQQGKASTTVLRVRKATLRIERPMKHREDRKILLEGARP
jgi:hypothetical protein